MMADTIDIQLMLGRLRPNSEYQWKGNGLGTYEDIGQWRDSKTTKPTLAEIQAEWTRYQTERQAETDRRTRLAQARQNYRAPEMDLTAYGSQSAIIQRLAQKIAWLEQEVADLRGGSPS
jgi:hypothetical protein